MGACPFLGEYTVGLRFLVSPQGHPIHTLTKMTNGALYTLTNNRKVSPVPGNEEILF